MDVKSRELAEITANLKVYDINAFNYYLKEIWIDLINRNTKNENDKNVKNNLQNALGVTRLFFSKYYALPGIIGDRLFRVFDTKANDILEFNEFKTGMNILFCEDYEKTLRFIFDFYDFDGDGKISKEDIRVVLSYVTYKNNDDEIEQSLNNKENEKSINDYNKKINKITKKLYESSVKNQSELIELLEKCFENEGELINYKSFTYIIDKINPDIYFIIYIFLLQNRPFSFKIIQLYENIINNKYKTTSVYLEKNNIINVFESYNKTPKKSYPYDHGKNISSTIDFSTSVINENVNASIEVEKNIFKKLKFGRGSSVLFDNEIKNSNGNNIWNGNWNIEKTVYEAILPKDIIDGLNTIKYNDEDYREYEEGVQTKNELFESETNNYEGYIYKFNNGKMRKIWFKLFYKDLFYYKNKEDIKHIGMHNLSGLFFKEESMKDEKYYSFSILFPSKKRTYFTDNEENYENWKKHLQIATNYSNILEIYDIKEELGSGSFSFVRLGINKKTKEKVAVKIMDKKKMSSIRLESARTEIEIMKICQHPNIIHYIDSYEDSDKIYIFMEYCEGGNFFNFLKKRDFILKEDLAVNIIHKLCMAVYYFHSFGITHRDLKPENILMTSEEDDADIRILDFGLGKIIGPNEKCSEPYGTIIYCAPEIILDYPYTKNVDSWSLGVITYIILYGRLPFWDKDRSKLSMQITRINPIYKIGSVHISDEAKNFIQSLLIKDQYKRMSIKKALEHKWFQKYNKSYIKYRSSYKKKDIFKLYTSLNLMDDNKKTL